MTHHELKHASLSVRINFGKPNCFIAWQISRSGSEQAIAGGVAIMGRAATGGASATSTVAKAGSLARVNPLGLILTAMLPTKVGDGEYPISEDERVSMAGMSESATGGPGMDPDDLQNSRLPKGGTYILRDRETGEIVRSGRTNNLMRREIEHARSNKFRDYDFEVVHRTDIYAEQRGLEQMLHDSFKPQLNRIRPINPLNPRRSNYIKAAEEYLKRSGG